MNEELLKLIDDGNAVVIFANDLGSYTAQRVPIDGSIARVIEDVPEGCTTDDFEPENAIDALCTKVFGDAE